MSDYQIIIARSVQKQLNDLPTDINGRILSKIDTLANEPRPSGCCKLRGEENSWRIRVGDYRVIYSIDDKTMIIDVQKVRHRRDVYNR